jgi:hypothetical protein
MVIREDGAYHQDIATVLTREGGIIEADRVGKALRHGLESWGLAAATTQIASKPGSVLPMVDTSGAIGGVMGGYALLYPRTRVHALITLGFFITTAAVPAVRMLGYWFVLQPLSGLPAIGSSQGGVT